MASILELQEFARRENEIKQNNNPFRNFALGFTGGLLDELKKKDEEKRRQDNVKKGISQFQQMMNNMNEMPDNSASARGVGLLDDEVNKDKKGIAGITRMIPQQEMSVDENGAVNIKIGMRATTPQEQAAQYEMMQKQMAQRKAEAKSQLLDGYIRGDIQEGAILKEMGSLEIKPGEFDMAAEARGRFRQVAQMQQQSMAQNQPQMSIEHPQPQEQPFMFDRSKALQEQKLMRETEDLNQKASAKVESAIANATAAKKTVQELKDRINEFGFTGPMPGIWGSDKQVFNANFESLKNKLTLEKLKELKEASSTGASGMGALSEKEGMRLETAATALTKALPKEKALEYLNDIESIFDKVLGGQGMPSSTVTREQAIVELKRRGKL